MSSILDALKKSERQRSLGRDLIFRSASRDAAPRLTGFAIAVILALAILAVAIGALFYYFREPLLGVAKKAAAGAIAAVGDVAESVTSEDSTNLYSCHMPTAPTRGCRGLGTPIRFPCSLDEGSLCLP